MLLLAHLANVSARCGCNDRAGKPRTSRHR